MSRVPAPAARAGEHGDRVLQRCRTAGVADEWWYAGAKATVRFIASYAAEESRLADHGIRFVSVLPKLTPDTDLGRVGVAAYAERAGLDVPGFLDQLGPSADAAKVARQVRMLATDTTYDAGAYLLPPQGEPRSL